MNGIIMKLTNNLKNIVFPVTVSKAIYMEDGQTNLDQKLTAQDNKIGNLSVNGITETSLAEAVKNDRSQLANIPNQSYITEKAKTVDVNNALASNYSILDAKINSQANGAPDETFATLTALQTAYPTGSPQNKLVSANNHIYAWKNSTWTDTGITFPNVGVSVNSVTSFNLTDDIKNILLYGNLYNGNTMEQGYYSTVNGAKTSATTFIRTVNKIAIQGGINYKVSATLTSGLVLAGYYACWYDINDVFISATNNTTGAFTSPTNARKMGFSIKVSAGILPTDASNITIYNDLTLALLDKNINTGAITKDKLNSNVSDVYISKDIALKSDNLLDYTPLAMDGSISKTLTTARGTIEYLDAIDDSPFVGEKMLRTVSTDAVGTAMNSYYRLDDVNVISKINSKGCFTIGQWVNKTDLSSATAYNSATKTIQPNVWGFDGAGTRLGYVNPSVSLANLSVGYSTTSSNTSMSAILTIDAIYGDWIHYTLIVTLTANNFSYFNVYVANYYNVVANTSMRWSVPKFLISSAYEYFKKYKNYNTSSTIISRLSGKKMGCLGDSITWLDGRTTSGYNNGNTLVKGYEAYFREKGAIVTNLGHSGAMIAKPSIASGSYTNSLYTDIITNNMDLSSYDIITIFAGTNDVAAGISFGNVGSYSDNVSNMDVTTTFPALRAILEYIRANNPTCELWIFTPIQNGIPSVRPYERLRACADGEIEIAKMYGVKYVDLLTECNFGKGNTDIYLYDGTHPNNTGYERIGGVLVRKVENS